MCVLPMIGQAIGGKVGGAITGLPFGLAGAAMGAALTKKKPLATPTGQPFLGRPGTIQPTAASPAGSSY